MVQIIIFLLLFVNNILCESIYQKISTNSVVRSYKAELQFEDDFKTIKSWTLSDSSLLVNSVNLPGTMCYVKKDEQKVECFCKYEQCAGPYFILDAIHKWSEYGGIGSVGDYELDVEFAQEIQKTVIKTIRSVINTFSTYSYSKFDPVTGEATHVSQTTYTFRDCSNLESPVSTGDILKINMTKLKTDRFPQFALQHDSLSILSLHPTPKDLQTPKLLGYLLFEFSGNRNAFWCASSSKEYEECDEAALKIRFECVISGIRKTANIIPPSFSPPTTSNNQSNVEFRHSSDFKVQDLSGLGVFLLLFVIPIMSLCIFYLIPEKIDHTPLDPTKFAENSKIREKVRLAEQVGDVEKP